MIKMLSLIFMFHTSLFSLKMTDTLVYKPKKITVSDVEEAKKELDFLEKKNTIRWKERKKNNVKFTRQNIEWARYLVIALLAVLIVGLILNYVFNKEKDLPKPLIDQLDIEEISEVNLQSLLDSALDDKNYSMALRIRFLIILQTLEAKKYIKWNKHKTNRKYINEMPNHLRSEFKNVAIAFDKVWYGNRRIDVDLYKKLSQNFQSFELKI